MERSFSQKLLILFYALIAASFVSCNMKRSSAQKELVADVEYMNQAYFPHKHVDGLVIEKISYDNGKNEMEFQYRIPNKVTAANALDSTYLYRLFCYNKSLRTDDFWTNFFKSVYESECTVRCKYQTEEGKNLTIDIARELFKNSHESDGQIIKYQGDLFQSWVEWEKKKLPMSLEYGIKIDSISLQGKELNLYFKPEGKKNLVQTLRKNRSGLKKNLLKVLVNGFSVSSGDLIALQYMQGQGMSFCYGAVVTAPSKADTISVLPQEILSSLGLMP